MPRLPRYDLPGQPQHVIQRGNNRAVIFRSEEDAAFFLGKLSDSCQRFDCALHAYVLMSNHVHLLMTPHRAGGLALAMQSLGRHYVRYFNTRHRRSGTLWEGRYRATLVDSERYLLTCMRYIELNPQRASLVAHPRDNTHSSYGGNALGATDPLLTPHEVYLQLGKTPVEIRRAYRALFRARLAETTLEEIRQATNKAWALGDDRFRTEVEALTGRRATPKARGGDRKSAAFRQSGRIKGV